MKELPLMEGETVQFQLEGDVWGGGSNPISQFTARITSKIAKLLGTRVKATLVVTDKRVIEFKETIAFWCVPTATDYKIVLPSSVKEIGYTQSTTCFCFSYFAFYYDSHTQRSSYPLLNVKEEDVLNYVDKFYTVLGKK